MGNTILVTGANRGIGLELCRQLALRGDRVIAACRSTSEALQRVDVRVVEDVDVSSDQSVASLARELGDTRLDWLVNNAGVLSAQSLSALDFDAMDYQYQINAIGPLRVTSALLPRLSKGSKIGIVTSRMGSIEDNTSGGHYGYRMSKAAVNMAGMSLARDLAESGIAVGLLHPGMVATDMTGGRGIAAEQSARGLIQRMDALSLANTGGFWHAEGMQLPW